MASPRTCTRRSSSTVPVRRTVPTVELQRALYTPGTAHAWDYFAFVTYLTHFVVPIGVAAVLWKVAHDKFRRYVFLFVSLTFITFLTYLFYPAVPPWMASRMGAIAPTSKIIDDMWIHIGLKSGAEVFLRDEPPGESRGRGAVAAHRVPGAHHVVLLERGRSAGAGGCRCTRSRCRSR